MRRLRLRKRLLLLRATATLAAFVVVRLATAALAPASITAAPALAPASSAPASGTPVAAAATDAADALGGLLERRRLRGQRLRDAQIGGGVRGERAPLRPRVPDEHL